jgi:two-component system CheB/CheR fusion protein
MDQSGSPDPDVTHRSSDFLVVGIGASAGGVEALKAFLRPLPPEPGYALVLVQHVSDSESGLMEEVFARFTGMPVLPVEDGLALEPNRLYLAPPNAIVGLKDGRFRLRPPRSPGERRNPIDRFFQTLSAVYGTEAVGIVLSGSGSDGALGLGSIGAAGGMTMAQAPDTAAFTDMPSSVAASADHVLAPEGLAEALETYARHWRAIATGTALGDRRREIQARLPEICDVLLRRTGHDFKHYKTSTLIRRLERRMQVRSLPDVDSYLGQLARDIHEPHILFRELLIGVTSFFREPDAFHALAERVIATLLQQRSATDQVRIWIPGCATGEEAYTIAMLVREKLDLVPAAPKVQIFATDVNERALVVARARFLSAGDRGACVARAPRPLLRETGPSLSGDGRAARDVPVLGPQPHLGPALLAPRRHLLPQSAHLSRLASAKEADPGLPLRAPPGRLSLPRRLREPDRPQRALPRHRRQAPHRAAQGGGSSTSGIVARVRRPPSRARAPRTRRPRSISAPSRSASSSTSSRRNTPSSPRRARSSSSRKASTSTSSRRRGASPTTSCAWCAAA